MTIAVVAAAVAGFVLLGVTYVIFPNQTSETPPPMPFPDWEKQFFPALLWMGVAALTSFVIISAVLLINRTRRRNYNRNLEFHFYFLFLINSFRHYFSAFNLWF
jgi:hypothetical protein